MKKINLWNKIIPIIIITFMTSFNIASAQNVSQERITMLVTFNVKADQKEALRKALIADKNGALNEKGNISMELFEHKDKPNTFYLFERWDNQKSLDEHFTKKYAKDVLELNKTALTKPMEILYLHDVSPLPKNEIKNPLSSDTPVDLVVIFKVKDGMQETFINQFQKSIVNSRPEQGNIEFFFHTVPGDNTKFVLYERWRSQAAIDFHFAQPYTKELFEMFKSALEQPIEEYLNFINEIGYAKRADK
ncbi:putative quinol monooxygenase [Chryseobacterium sp. Mn2064]|uniref:putative quinol monooxygenase n=1 Tax=Chryseobacterium sp. Mn2064 TaxID=3395263 RepID=UPI003BCBBB68